MPAMATYYPRMKTLNARAALDLREISRLKPLSPAEIVTRMDAGRVALLDLRRPESFGGAHMPGALNIGTGQNLSLWAGWMLDPEVPIVLINESGEVNEAALSLLRVGLDSHQKVI